MRTTRSTLSLAAIVVLALMLGGCGSQSVQLSADDPDHHGAELFAERCAGCHTLKAAGALGSVERDMRIQGPNLDQRIETVDDVLFAIHNGGFSGAIMPQNIVVGDDAKAVAEFVARYAGTELDRPPTPGSDDNS